MPFKDLFITQVDDSQITKPAPYSNDLLSKKILIGTIILFVVTIVASVLPWFSVREVLERDFFENALFSDSYIDKLSSNGWDGSILVVNFKIPNWFVVINHSILLLLLILKNTKIWSLNSLLAVLLLIPTFLHLIFLFIGIFELNSRDLSLIIEPGYYLFILNFFVTIRITKELFKY